MATSISAEKIFSDIISFEVGDEEKLSDISQLKAHVKKDFVDLRQVPKYMEALSIGVDSKNSQISSTSFNVISHLVKRVSMQDSSGEVLRSQSYLLLSIIISKLADSKSSTRASARKALEAYWLSASKEVEDSINNLALTHNDMRVVRETLEWIDSLVTTINPKFRLSTFFPNMVKLLKAHNVDEDSDLFISLVRLLQDYYSLKHNKLYKFDFTKELEVQGISGNLKNKLYDAIGISGSDRNSPEAFEHSQHTKSEKKFLTAGQTRITIAKPTKARIESSKVNISSRANSTHLKSHEKAESRSLSYSKQSQDEPGKGHLNTVGLDTSRENMPKRDVASDFEVNSQGFDINPEIEKLISNLFKYEIDDDITQISITDVSELHFYQSEHNSIFTNKETESNWGRRERFIVKIRGMLRGNIPSEYTYDFLNFLREIADGINKGITSLRTTLCTHSCLLVKEAAMILRSSFDAVIDLFIPTLAKSCSSTKSITSNNANIALCAIYINASFSIRLMQRIQSAASDKSIHPRSYSGIWLQIFTIRFHEASSFLSNHGNYSALEISSKILQKILGDPNPTVRQVAKSTYWCFWKYFPNESESLLKKLDMNVVKGIERSKPKEVLEADQPATLAMLNTKKSRPSLKETIMARNKELRKQRELNSVSRSSSRIDSRSPNPFDFSSLPKNSEQVSNVEAKPASNRTTTRRNFSAPVAYKIDNAKELEKRETERFRTLSSLTFKSDLSPPKKSGKEEEEEEEDINSSYKQFDIPSSFDKQSDPILKFLSSNNLELISEGINLLKFAVMGDEDLSAEINTLLLKVSLKYPHQLEPIFNGNDSLLKRMKNFFTSVDFLRVFFLLNDTINEGKANFIINLFEIDDIYASVTLLASYVANINNISKDSDLTMQVIKYKSRIIGSLVNFLLFALDKIPINDSSFSKLCSNFFELVGIVKSTIVYSSFSSLLSKLYSINGTLFTSELELTSSITKEEVEYVVGIDDVLDLRAGNTTQFGSLFELTKVMPGSNFEKLSPLKTSSDLTMLVPENGTGKLTFKPRVLKLNAIKQDNEDHFPTNVSYAAHLQDSKSTEIIEAKESLPSISHSQLNSSNRSSLNYKSGNLKETDEMQIDDDSQQINETPDKGESTPCSPHLTPAIGSNVENSELVPISKDRSSELADNFASVKLSDRKSESISIQTFIEKVDPINKATVKNKQINIFEDNTSGSPQKVKQYNYKEKNWFNFQLAKCKLDEEMDNESVGSFNELCFCLEQKKIDGRQFVQLLNHIQRVEAKSLSFANFYYGEGKEILESALWRFYEAPLELSLSQTLSGLILLKQLLLNGSIMNLKNVWDLLCSLSISLKNFYADLSYAISETFDEVLAGAFRSENILILILDSLSMEERYLNNNSSELVFVLTSLLKFIDSSSFDLLVNDTTMEKIHALLNIYLNHEMVDVRRLVISCYGKMISAYKAALSGETLGSPSLILQIMSTFTVPQKKLIEYYGQLNII